MKLIILAAGTGSRLWPMTKHVPKSLIDLGDGRCLLERQIENAAQCDEIDEVIVVTGYRASQVERRMRHIDANINIRTLYNPVYNMTSNLLSVWVARMEMSDDDFLISNGDNLYKRTILPNVINTSDGIWLTIDRKSSYDEDDMKVTLEDDTVQNVSKDIAQDLTHAESVGLVAVRGTRMRQIFRSTLDEAVRSQENLSKFWLELFNILTRNGSIVRTVEVPSEHWVEVDFHPDIQRIRDDIASRISWTDD